MNFQYIQVNIDPTILSNPIGSQILSSLATLGVEAFIESQQIAEIISWRRSVQQKFSKDEPVIYIQDTYRTHFLKMCFINYRYYHQNCWTSIGCFMNSSSILRELEKKLFWDFVEISFLCLHGE